MLYWAISALVSCTKELYWLTSWLYSSTRWLYSDFELALLISVFFSSILRESWSNWALSESIWFLRFVSGWAQEERGKPNSWTPIHAVCPLYVPLIIATPISVYLAFRIFA